MKYPQFTAVTGTNNDLEDLNNFANIGYYDGKIWWVVGNIVNAYTIELIFKSTDLITGTTSTERTVQWGSGDAADTNMTFEMCTISIEDDNIYGLIAFHYYDNSTTKWNTYLYWSYTNNGGGAWVEDDFPIEAVNDEPTIFISTHRCFNLGGVYYLVAGVHWTFNRIYLGQIAAPFTYETVDNLNHLQALYQGCVIDDEYWFVYYNGTNLILASYAGGTTYTVEETLTTLTIPAAWNAQNQIYWKQGGLEILMDQDHLYTRLNGSAWVSMVDDGTTTNAIIWDYNTDGTYKINYIIWKDSIFKILDGNALVKIQYPFTDNAYVGWSDWFANGADTIYQLDLATLNYVRVATGKRVLYESPQMEIICQTEPFEEQFVQLYDDNEELLISDYIAEYETSGEEFRWLVGNHPDLIEPAGAIYTDLVRKVDEVYTAQTAHAILKDVLDTYCQFLFYDAGIDDTPASTYTISFRNKTVLDVMRWADATEGYQTSWRPNCEVFWDQYTAHDWDYKRAPRTLQWGTAAIPILTEWTADYTVAFEVISPLLIHKNILHAEHFANFYRDNSSAFTSGTLEFFIILGQTDKIVRVYLYNSTGSDYLVVLSFLADGNYDFLGATTDTDIAAYAADTLYHISIGYLKNGNCTLTVNGVLKSTITGKDLTFERILCDSSDDAATEMWIDAIGDSNDGYVAGTNQEQIADFSLSNLAEMKPMKKKYGRFLIMGGYLNGVKLYSEILVDPNYATYIDEFPEIIVQATLDTLAAQIASDRATAINKLRVPMIGCQWPNPGQELTVVNTQHTITRSTWYCIESLYDLTIDESRIILTDAYWQPPLKENQASINSNLTQEIGVIEDKTASFNALGSANAQWKPCVFEIESVVGKVYGVNSRLQNVDGTDYEVFYVVPLEHTKGTLKLYISGIQVNIGGADATNYLTGTYLQSITGTSTANAASHTTDYDSAQVMEYLFAAVDASTWNRAGLLLQAVVANAGTFKLGGVKIRYYYA